MVDVTKPLASTVRVVEWDELPPRAREIPNGFDPLADGILMRHQVQCLAIRASIVVVPKGRRTGMTFAFALNKTITAASRKSAGGDNVYYIGDTKEKGLEFVGYCAKFARVIAQAQGQGISRIEEFLFEDQDDNGRTKYITAYRIRFASGFQITALSSRPANIRGLQGHVIIDEAAFHPDVQGVLDAATALLIWGGEIVIISSHNGVRNPFNQLVKDIENGRYGDDAVVFPVTFDDAVGNGLYERVCLIKGWTPSVDGKRAWYEKIRNGYGARKAAMREELDAIPRDGGGRCIPGIWIENAMPEVRPVLRLALDSAFQAKSNYERESLIAEWIERELKPLFRLFDPRFKTVFGEDFARHRDFSAIVPMQITHTLSRNVPFVVELHNVPTRQQEQILWAIVDALPNRCGGAMDATGAGQTLAEYTGDKYGRSHIAEVVLSRAWYGAWMPKLVQAFEDGVIFLPRDDGVADDLRAIEDVDGIPMVSAIRREDIKDPDLLRHGDVAIATALAYFASLNLSAQIAFIPVPARSRGFDNVIGNDVDDDFHIAEPSTW
ncbi:MAG TPA: hypothetical protein VJ724_07195 [Tahibacter sp.]|nr:hypothetical protein [Tahibacter sp.]